MTKLVPCESRDKGKGRGKTRCALVSRRGGHLRTPCPKDTTCAASESPPQRPDSIAQKTGVILSDLSGSCIDVFKRELLTPESTSRVRLSLS